MNPVPQPKVQPPELPRQLPAGALDALEDYSEHAALSVSGGSLAGSRAAHPVFEQMLFRRVALGPSLFTRPRFLDCRLNECDLAGIDWEQARFRRVALTGCRLIGAQLLESEFEDVTLRNANLESAVFVSARFKAVRFENCVLREASFENADLSGVVFADCDLAGADLRQAKLEGTDLRGSRLGGVQVGAPELKGAIVDPAQAVQIAALIGLIVKEVGEELDE